MYEELNNPMTPSCHSEALLYRNLMLLFGKQTPLEQDTFTTKESNGVGFNAADAPTLTRYAFEVTRTGCLMKSKRDDCRRRLRKYHRQTREF